MNRTLIILTSITTIIFVGHFGKEYIERKAFKAGYWLGFAKSAEGSFHSAPVTIRAETCPFEVSNVYINFSKLPPNECIGLKVVSCAEDHRRMWIESQRNTLPEETIAEIIKAFGSYGVDTGTLEME